MLRPTRHDIVRLTEPSAAYDAAGPLIAHVYGATPPDFAAVAACGFAIVCIDSSAAWYRADMIADAQEHGLQAFAFPMAYRR